MKSLFFVFNFVLAWHKFPCFCLIFFILHHFVCFYSEEEIKYVLWERISGLTNYCFFFCSWFTQKMAYVRNVLNIVEWICYVAALVFVIPPCDCKLGGKLEVGAVALFFGWMNLILYFRRYFI